MVGKAELGVIKRSLCRTSPGLGCWKSLCGRESLAWRPSKALKFPGILLKPSFGAVFFRLHLQVEVWLPGVAEGGWRRGEQSPGVVWDGREGMDPVHPSAMAVPDPLPQVIPGCNPSHSRLSWGSSMGQRGH